MLSPPTTTRTNRRAKPQLPATGGGMSNTSRSRVSRDLRSSRWHSKPDHTLSLEVLKAALLRNRGGHCRRHSPDACSASPAASAGEARPHWRRHRTADGAGLGEPRLPTDCDQTQKKKGTVILEATVDADGTRQPRPCASIGACVRATPPSMRSNNGVTRRCGSTDWLIRSF